MRWTVKEFLSPSPDESGSIICTIKTSLVKDMTPHSYAVRTGGSMNASIRLSDCSNHILLDFDAEGQKSFDKRIQKLDKLIGHLQDMRSQMNEVWSSHLRDVEHFKKQECIK